MTGQRVGPFEILSSMSGDRRYLTADCDRCGRRMDLETADWRFSETRNAAVHLDTDCKEAADEG